MKRHRPQRAGTAGRRSHWGFELLEPRLALSATVLNESFDDDPVGGLPNSADYLANAAAGATRIQIAGPGGAYASPLGEPGNHALAIDDAAAPQAVVGWHAMFPDNAADFTTGRIEFDLYLPEPQAGDFWTYLEVRLGYGGASRTAPTTVNDTTVWNTFRILPGAFPDLVFDSNAGSGGSPIAADAPLRVRYDLDGASRTYRLSINGVTMNFGGSPDRAWRAGATGVNMLGFFGATAQASAPVYVDNLLVVNDDAPEPWTPPANEPTDVQQWHQHRGNKRLTGEATISQPILANAEILWSHDIGSRESWVAAGFTSGAESASLQLPQANLTMSLSDRAAYGVGGPYFDLDGTGALTAVSTSANLRIGDFIPGNGTLEKIEGQVFDTVDGEGVVRLFVRQNGAWVEVWETPAIPHLFATSNFITGDFDGDGSLELAFSPWYDLYVLDLATGAIEQIEEFKPPANQSGRPYGWLGAYDVTGDGRDEFFLLGDFQDFIVCMGWNAQGNVIKLWEHVFDPSLSDKRTTHRPVAFPLIDVTGDGRADVVTSVLNEHGDNRWHLLVFDAATGTLTHDLPDHAVDGARDLDGDGDMELFVRQTQGSLLPLAATVKILDVVGPGFAERWSQAGVEFVAQSLGEFPAEVNSRTATLKLDVLTGSTQPGGPQLFATRRILDAAVNLNEIVVWQLDGQGGATAVGSARGLDLDLLAIRATADGAESLLFSTEVAGATAALPGDFNADRRRDGFDFLAWQAGFGAPAGAATADGDADGDGDVDAHDFSAWSVNFGARDPNSFDLLGLAGVARYSQAGAPPRSSAVVGRLGGPTDRPTVIVQGGSETIVALQPNADGTVDPIWTRSGLGGFFGATQQQGQHENVGIVLGDVDGDANLEAIYATTSEAGQARLVAARPDGSELWHADFNVPGGKRVFNQAGLTLWRTGRFTSPDREDVLVQIMQGIGGTGEFHLLDGRTGQELWSRVYGNTPGSSTIQRGAGEAQLAVYDWDRDGLDEAVNFNPDMFYVVDGDGTNLIDRAVFNGGVFPGGSPLYATPVVADFLGNQTDSILFAGSYSQFGLVDRTAAPQWSKPLSFDAYSGFIQGVGDADGDGDLDLFSTGVPGSPGNTAASTFQTFDARTGQLLWQVALPGRSHAPVGGAYFDTPTVSVSADVDQDGRVESVFAIDKTLYVVGSDPGGASGRIEWSLTLDDGRLGSPIIADGDGDGQSEIIVVSTSGRVYGIGTRTLGGAVPSAAANMSAPVQDAGLERLAASSNQPLPDATAWIADANSLGRREATRADRERRPFFSDGGLRSYASAVRAEFEAQKPDSKSNDRMALDEAFSQTTTSPSLRWASGSWADLLCEEGLRRVRQRM